MNCWNHKTTRKRLRMLPLLAHLLTHWHTARDGYFFILRKNYIRNIGTVRKPRNSHIWMKREMHDFCPIHQCYLDVLFRCRKTSHQCIDHTGRSTCTPTRKVSTAFTPVSLYHVCSEQPKRILLLLPYRREGTHAVSFIGQSTSRLEGAQWNRRRKFRCPNLHTP